MMTVMMMVMLLLLLLLMMMLLMVVVVGQAVSTLQALELQRLRSLSKEQ